MTLSLDKTESLIFQRRDATWQDYVAIREGKDDWRKIAFHAGWLWVDMGTEGPNHASFSDLITAVFLFGPFYILKMPCNPMAVVYWSYPILMPVRLI